LKFLKIPKNIQNINISGPFLFIHLEIFSLNNPKSQIGVEKMEEIRA